ncbi:hypothetical protein Tco_0574006 [Tanacetum coccineum]
MPKMKFNVLAQHLQEIMEEALPKMVDNQVKELTKTQVPVYVAHGLIMERQQSQADVAKIIVDSSVRSYMSGHILHLALKYKFERLHVSNTPCRPSVVRPRDQEDHHDDAHPEGKNSAKRKKSSKHGTFVIGESSSRQINESKPSPSTSRNQEQLDNFDLWTNSYATDDDELPTKKVSQELVEEMSQTVDEAKLRKVVNEIDPKAPALSLVNQDLLYLKKGNSGPEKIVMSLHKFPAVIFPDDDIKERTSRWVDKCVKKFNPYARYNVKHWKNPHAKIFYINKQREPGKPKEIIARIANGSIVSITESEYKNLNKNDIEDMYLLIVNGKLGVESYQQKVNLTAPIINFLGIEKYKVFSIVSEPVYGIIYKNSKKEKRVTRHQEIHKFCDATLKRVLEGLKSYNNNVKHGYVTPSLSKEDAEYLQLFDEEIEERLKHHD